MKIDVFCHVIPQAFYNRMMSMAEQAAPMQKRVREIPVLTDVELRLRIMDQFPGYRQVPCLATPPIEVFGDPKIAPELARIANDGMAELVSKHPDRFVAFAASLPMNNMDACLKEVDREIGRASCRERVFRTV